MDIDWDAAGGPSVTIQGVGVDGQAFYQHTIAHHELVPSRLNDTEERAYRTDCAYERVYTNAGSVKARGTRALVDGCAPFVCPTAASTHQFFFCFRL